jgi:hypothetical protein
MKHIRSRFLILPVISMLSVLLTGCTTAALRRNAFNQSKTVGEFLADQVLFNLALFEKHFNDPSQFNGIPSFIKLSTGQAQVQQSVNGQLALKFPLKGGDEIDPQISANHLTQDNWTFVPVVEPVELRRLYYLYHSVFQPASEADLAAIFPPAPNVGPDGRPVLTYEPVIKNGVVEMINNQPQFTAKLPAVPKHTVAEIPGALGKDGQSKSSWFSFTPPPKGTTNWVRTGPYLGRDIWITSKENFFQFALLTLGSTNSTPGAVHFSMPPYSLQNGLFLPLK